MKYKLSLLFYIESYDAKQQPDGSWLHDDGDIYWHNRKGMIHRDDGPAIIGHDGAIYWYYKDNRYTFNQWLQVCDISEKKKLALALRYM